MLSVRDEKTYYYLYLDDETQATVLKILGKNLFPRYFNKLDKE